MWCIQRWSEREIQASCCTGDNIQDRISFVFWWGNLIPPIPFNPSCLSISLVSNLDECHYYSLFYIYSLLDFLFGFSSYVPLLLRKLSLSFHPFTIWYQQCWGSQVERKNSIHWFFCHWWLCMQACLFMV